MRQVRLSTINTPSQKWARRHGACLSGRRRLGRLTLWQYFNRTGHFSDMMWIARRLEPNDPTLITFYMEQLGSLDNWVRGAYHSPFTYRKAVKLVMRAYDARWPVEVL